MRAHRYRNNLPQMLKKTVIVESKFSKTVRKPWEKSRKAAKRAKRLREKQKRLALGLKPLWTLKVADANFSAYIRNRDKRCLFPECKETRFEKLQCSHYFGRATKSTRFDPQNCITLCWFHHFKSKDLGYEYQKQRAEKHGWDGQYTSFMKNLLGGEGWYELVDRASQSLKQKTAIENCMTLLSDDK